jgi:hypothetical protein
MKEKSVPMLRWIIEREAGAKFAFETLDEAKRWTTANGFDTGTTTTPPATTQPSTERGLP